MNYTAYNINYIPSGYEIISEVNYASEFAGFPFEEQHLKVDKVSSAFIVSDRTLRKRIAAEH